MSDSPFLRSTPTGRRLSPDPQYNAIAGSAFQSAGCGSLPPPSLGTCGGWSGPDLKVQVDLDDRYEVTRDEVARDISASLLLQTPPPRAGWEPRSPCDRIY
eukprot:TRINITY_DN21410_c0_g2_i1.p2 TRINITY_DN21410_c0_g2~~TRINITY_DN21410_c0_g2_i1.p2  ORF type:complete len:101 (+),score=15.55 TRINITY_DN21410_c0_g2_i1:125-427(+)